MVSRIISLFAFVFVTASVLWWVDGAAVVAQLGDLSITWVCLGVIALTVATLSMARRWQVVATHLGLRLSLGSALREYYLGMFINQVLPGGVTGDVARAFRVRKEADLKTAAVSVALERLLGQFAIFALLAVGLAATVFLPGSLERGHWLWVAILGLLALSLAGLVLSRQDGALGRFATLALALQRRPELIAHAVLTCGCLVFSFYACARATGTVLPVIATATLIPLILIAMLIPLSVGGWGWREGAAAALFPLIGEAPSAGVAAGVAYGATVLVAALPATLIILTTGLSKPLPTSDSKG